MSITPPSSPGGGSATEFARSVAASHRSFSAQLATPDLLPITPPTGSPLPSPRLLRNEPCARWITTGVEIKKLDSTNTRVTVEFADETQHKIPLSQLVYLANQGVKTMKFDLGMRKIDLNFSNFAQAHKFALLLLNALNTPSVSHAVDPFPTTNVQLFSSWHVAKVEEVSVAGYPSANVKFYPVSDEDPRKVVFSQLERLKEEKGLVELEIAVDSDQTIKFCFEDQDSRSAFMTKITAPKPAASDDSKDNT